MTTVKLQVVDTACAISKALFFSSRVTGLLLDVKCGLDATFPLMIVCSSPRAFVAELKLINKRIQSRSQKLVIGQLYLFNQQFRNLLSCNEKKRRSRIPGLVINISAKLVYSVLLLELRLV